MTNQAEFQDGVLKNIIVELLRHAAPRMVSPTYSATDATEALVEAEKELSELKGLFAGRNPEKCTVSDNARLAALKEEADGEDH